jgi:hypothetical protein
MGLLRDRGYAIADIAEATGLSRSRVSFYLRLLDLDEASRVRVSNGTIRPADAVAAVRSARRTRRGGAADRPVQVSPPRLDGRHTLTGQSCPPRRRRRIEDYADLRAWGLSRREAAERLGVDIRTTLRYDRDLRDGLVTGQAKPGLGVAL